MTGATSISHEVPHPARHGAFLPVQQLGDAVRVSGDGRAQGSLGLPRGSALHRHGLPPFDNSSSAEPLLILALDHGFCQAAPILPYYCPIANLLKVRNSQSESRLQVDGKSPSAFRSGRRPLSPKILVSRAD